MLKEKQINILSNKKTIIELSNLYNIDKKMENGIVCNNGVYGHNYAKYYDLMLKKQDVFNLLEIGVSAGLSLKMWNEFFQGKTNIWGIEINEKKIKKENVNFDKIKILIGDQSDIDLLLQLKDISFDLIIDDGSHRMKDQQISFKILFNYIRSGGVYVIEDLHTSKKNKFYDSDNETTTTDVLLSLKNKKEFISNYINKIEYNNILNSIKKIEFQENNKICFIYKK